MPHRFLWIMFILVTVCAWKSTIAFAQSREEKVRNDKLKFENKGLWYYNDLNKAFDVAKQTQKPLLVVLRCIPCEECVKLDDELMESSEELQSLLKSFVLVRVVGTNGLDLSLFEFDTDQSFAVFFFHPDRTLYGRYGTRSHEKEWEADVSVEGLSQAIQAVLKLHRSYPWIRSSLAGKQANAPKFSSPERIPALASKFTDKLDYDGNVVKSCIHCHQIGDAMRTFFRGSEGKLPEQWLFPYPHPKSVGIILDPRTCGKVVAVAENSFAAHSGLKVGDEIVSMQNQPIISCADIQWVLHNATGERTVLDMTVQRDGQDAKLQLELPPNWKRKDNISWRVSSWELRRLGLGGQYLKPLSPEDRRSHGLSDGQMAHLVQHVGSYSPHDGAKRAGVEKGDIMIEFDGKRDFLRETDLLAYALNEIAPGAKINVTYLRGKVERKVVIETAK